MDHAAAAAAATVTAWASHVDVIGTSVCMWCGNTDAWVHHCGCDCIHNIITVVILQF